MNLSNNPIYGVLPYSTVVNPGYNELPDTVQRTWILECTPMYSIGSESWCSEHPDVVNTLM